MLVLLRFIFCASGIVQLLYLLSVGSALLSSGCEEFFFIFLWDFGFKLLVHPHVRSKSSKRNMILDQNIVNLLFLGFNMQYFDPIEAFTEFAFWFSILFEAQFSFRCESFWFFDDKCLYWVWSSGLPRFWVVGI